MPTYCDRVLLILAARSRDASSVTVNAPFDYFGHSIYRDTTTRSNLVQHVLRIEIAVRLINRDTTDA